MRRFQRFASFSFLTALYIVISYYVFSADNAGQVSSFRFMYIDLNKLKTSNRLHFNRDHFNCSLADWTSAVVASILALKPAWTWATVCSASGTSSLLSCALETTSCGSVSMRIPLSHISSRASKTMSILSRNEIKTSVSSSEIDLLLT